MAMQSIGSVIAPVTPSSVSGLPSYITTVVDADGEGVALIFEAPETGTITGFGCQTGTLTAGDAGTLFALRNVDVSASPAVPGATTHWSGAINVAASTTWYEITGQSYAATQGELLACVVTRPVAGSLNTQFRLFTDDGGSNVINFPFCSANVGAGFVAAGNAPCFSVNYGGTYYPIRGTWPFSANFTAITVGSGSTPDVVGNLWIPRVKCRVRGFWVWMDMDGSVLIKFYDTDGVTVLATATLAANARGGTGAGLFFVPFDDTLGPTSVTPTVGSTYWYAVEPSSATTITMYDFTVNAAAVMGMFGFGTDMYKATAKDPSGTGSWTNVTTQRVFMGLIIDQFDDGVQVGGGGARNVQVNGGGWVA